MHTHVYKLSEFIFGMCIWVIGLNTLYWAVNKAAHLREKLILLNTGVISCV